MANTRDRHFINPPIRFRCDLVPIDKDQSTCHPPVNNGSSTLLGSARPVSQTYFQSTDVCPSCQTSNHSKSGRYCASCGIFYHLACARLKKAESSGLRTWLCQRCLFPERAILSSPQLSTAPSMNKHLLDKREQPMDSPNCVDNADNVLKRISQLHRFYRIPIRIPVAEALAEAIDRTITPASNTDWNNFAPFIFSLWAQITQVPPSHPSSVQILNDSHNLLSIKAPSASSCRVIKLAESHRHPRTSAPTSTLS